MLKAMWLILLTIASHEATPLSGTIDNHLGGDNRRNTPKDNILHLSPGVFELLDYPVTSTTLRLEGTTSTITHASPEIQAVTNELDNNSVLKNPFLPKNPK
ncbi:hypothetical protein BLNAU_21420 [Blattamonas nauphoetae]|uniref:Uncharacterized protein n=1 Tax=Blattamonas nauphoetae TaxID=2049346 RepID=A0ABQ9WW01_9EUKA|nr:hypothetical protein BLNAU_21420 [Blattamonas nauphoetae]